jgi:NADPH-dependent 2,4-dienoyl-CoA reductase/sulfur reductase-like enzyme
VIVGGGVGGVATAAALRAGGYDGELTLVEGSEFPYDRPPLSKSYLAGAESLAGIALQRPEWYEAQEIRLLGCRRVTALRPGEGRVELSSGEMLASDRVVLATGGHAARPPIRGVDSSRVHAIRDHQDADRLRYALVPGARLLVVGGGLVGAEVASTAVDLGVSVTLIDPVAIPLELAVGPEVGAWLHELHARRGVATVKAALLRLDDVGGEIFATIAGHDEPLAFDAVVLGVGLRPETSLAEAIRLEVDRGIVVDAGQVTSNPAILAVGDPTRRRIDGELRPRAEHWEAAQHDGGRAAASILGAAPPAPSAPWFWTDRHHLHVEGVGHMAMASERVMRGVPGDGPFSAWGLRDGHVVAAVSVNDSNAVRAARRMIDRGVAVSGSVLSDPETDLRRLLRA